MSTLTIIAVKNGFHNEWNLYDVKELAIDGYRVSLACLNVVTEDEWYGPLWIKRDPKNKTFLVTTVKPEEP